MKQVTKIIDIDGVSAKTCDNCGHNLFYHTRGYSRKYTNKEKTEGIESARYINTCTNCGWKDYQPIYTKRRFTITHGYYMANSKFA